MEFFADATVADLLNNSTYLSHRTTVHTNSRNTSEIENVDVDSKSISAISRLQTESLNTLSYLFGYGESYKTPSSPKGPLATIDRHIVHSSEEEGDCRRTLDNEEEQQPLHHNITWKKVSERKYANGDTFTGAVDSFTGEALHGRRLYIHSAEIYEGNFGVNSERHGEGAVCTRLDGSGKYLGSFRNDLYHVGTLVTPDFTYTGKFVDNSYHGAGMLVLSDGTVYEGEFAKGIYHGAGKLNDVSDGSTYTGGYCEGQRQGIGTLVEFDGKTYSGDWNKSVREGEGSETLPSGESYTGSFSSDQRHAQGVLTKPDKTIMEGTWKNGAPVSSIEWNITYPNGVEYSGDVCDCFRPHGHGTIFVNTMNGKNIFSNQIKGEVTYNGEFRYGMRWGDGICVFRTGEEYCGKWITDQPVGLNLLNQGVLSAFKHDVKLKNEEHSFDEKKVEEGGIPRRELFLSSPATSDKALFLSSRRNKEASTKLLQAYISSNEQSESVPNLTGSSNCSSSRSSSEHLPIEAQDESIIMNHVQSEKQNPSTSFHVFANSDTFLGVIDSNSLRQGFGVYTEHRSGSIFEGHWLNDRMHDQGVLTTCCTKYDGIFVNGKPNGLGKLTTIDGSTFSGNFVDGVFHSGTLSKSVGESSYCGDWADGFPHGSGVETLQHEIYDGRFKSGKRHGRGILKTKCNNIIYEGAWEDGLLHGKGIYKYEYQEKNSYEANFKKYEGLFSHGLRSGEGILLLTDGSRIEGSWVEDRPVSGDWCISYVHGSNFFGLAKCKQNIAMFCLPVPHGFGTLRHSNGNSYSGSFVDGIYVD